LSELRQKRVDAFRSVDLYPVTSAEFSSGRSTMEIVKSIIAAGCRIVQLREKLLNKYEYFELAKMVRELTLQTDILMICNDHLDVALAVNADGVHLGTDDLPLTAARKIAPDLIIGASTHSLEEAMTAQKAGADYVNIGPIFPTFTKQAASKFLGPNAISMISPHLQVPFTVMGGINVNNIGQVLEAGARRIAVVTAITAAQNPKKAAELLRKMIRDWKE